MKLKLVLCLHYSHSASFTVSYLWNIFWMILPPTPQILTPFLLRRLKSDVTLEVPPKKEIVVYAPLTPKQELFYTAVVNKSIAKMLGQEKVG